MKVTLYTARALGIMVLGIVVVIAIFMPMATSDNPWIGWITTIFGIALFLLLAYMEGAARGEAEAGYLERAEKRKQSGETDLSDVKPEKCYSRTKGLLCSAVIAGVMLVFAILAIIVPLPEPYYVTVPEDIYATPSPSLRIGETPAPAPTLAPGETPQPQPGDVVLYEPQSMFIVTIRLIHAPYIRLFTTFEDTAIVKNALYVACCFPYPVVLLIGYLMGPKQRKRIHKTIEKNEMDYKKKQKYMRRRKQMFR